MKSDTCFLNAGIGQWYSTGSERLAGSLRLHGFPGDVITWIDQWPNHGFSKDCIYNVKAAAFEEAIKRGYRTLIWGDSSIYALKPTQPFVDRIKADGYWFGMSGYNCAQVCSDKQIQYFGVSRDWAAAIPDTATGLFGVNLDNPLAAKFVELWIKAAHDGVFSGSRFHGGQSKDKRFKFGRQDQATASLICGTLGMTLSPFISFAGYAWDAGKHDTIFRCQGM